MGKSMIGEYSDNFSRVRRRLIASLGFQYISFRSHFWWSTMPRTRRSICWWVTKMQAFMVSSSKLCFWSLDRAWPGYQLVRWSTDSLDSLSADYTSPGRASRFWSRTEQRSLWAYQGQSWSDPHVIDGPLPFVLSNTIVTVPFLFACALLFSLICYFAIGLHPGGGPFFRFLGYLFLALYAAESQ